MTRSTMPGRHQDGFTLIEAIAVIVITGIIGAVIAVFVAKPVQGYVDSARRAVLSDMADTSLRRIGREIRTAVPNSVRVPGGSGLFLEFVPSTDGVRYRVEQTGGAGDILDFSTAADNAFDVFGVSPVAASANDYFVIFNTGQCDAAGCSASCSASGGANVYQGCNRRVITAATTTAISFTATALPLPFDSPGHRLQTVPSTGPVTYACENVATSGGNGTGTLTRYTGYQTSSNWNAATQPTSFPVSGSLLADAVSACAFSYSAGVTERSGLAILSLTLTRVNESVTLYYEIHVDNQP